MKETLEKILDLGIGTIAYSKDKITAFVDDLVDRGEIKKEEASAMVEELTERGKREKKNVEAIVREQFAKIKKETVTREEVRAIIREEIQRAASQKQATSSDSDGAATQAPQSAPETADSFLYAEGTSSPSKSTDV
uniref:phasin family protein n=1 Tax=Ndongobacter massiliensis TaxID=1871025 RepID=UPI000930F249|nr:hypothetical protein [Ndongobacter massiliensis]